MVSSRRVLIACVVVAALLFPLGASVVSAFPPTLLLSAGAGVRPSSADPAVTSAPAVRQTLSPSVTRSSPPGVTTPSSVISPTATVPAPSLSAASPQVLSGWDALHFGTNGGLSDPYVPPDVIVAAGPDRVVEMTNLLMGVYTKQGTGLNVTNLVSLFRSGSDFVSDPKVQYDAPSGRWFASLTDVTATQVLLAVSATADPTGSWHLYRVPSAPTGNCLDQPILGVGTSTVIVSVNVFTQTNPSTCVNPFLGAEYWVINKTDLVTGAASPAFHDSGINLLEGSIHPVQIEGSSLSNYMVSTYWPGTATTSNTLHLFTVSGTPPGAVSVTVTSLSMQTAALPPSASQLGTRNMVDTADLRISDAVWSEGELWLGFDEACLSDASRACIRLVQIDTTATAVVQDFDIDVAGRDVFYPGLRVDGSGDLAVVFGFSSSSDYPGIMATGRTFGDAPNTLQAPQIVVAGTASEQGFCSKGVCRYGDYFGASRDPSNASVVWLAGQMGTASGWSTHIFSATVKAELTMSYQVVGGGSGYGAPTVTVVQGGTPAQVALSTSPAIVLADPGSAWSVRSLLSGSSMTSGEVWALNASSGAPTSFAWANASVTLAFTYFHQYRASLGFTVAGGSGYVGPPEVTAVVFGVPTSLATPGTFFLDAGSHYAYQDVLRGSTSSERWVTTSAANGTVPGALALNIPYYHQYQVTFDYLVEGTAAGPSPSVHYSSFGASASVTANATVWADAAHSYAFDVSLTGGHGTGRIGAGTGATGNVTAAGTITVTYRVQYLLSVYAEPAPLLANVSGAGWYDLGSVASLTAVAPSGWQFVGWSGSLSGASPSATITMDGPGNVTALFYPSLTIVAGAGGSVAYSYGSVSGVVPAGSSKTIYAPAGTAVTLTAMPSSWTDEFISWSGGASGSTGSTSFTLSGPATVSAAFGTNALVVAGIAGGVIAVILALLAFVLLARRRRKQPPA